ncbi:MULTISPECIES: hypothetical protein [Sphingobacterium]|uniref:hypothetical protein n=1 Tax=Sphingobacterium TaxID=28453 RepID=UPI00257BB947|nr:MULTISPECIES: hypothetical protein [Sphingobacterium]
MAWFSFTGSDPADPADYTLSSSQPSCTGTPQQLCAIQATNNGGHPDLDTNILSEMVQALNNQANTTNVKLKVRPA